MTATHEVTSLMMLATPILYVVAALLHKCVNPALALRLNALLTCAAVLAATTALVVSLAFPSPALASEFWLSSSPVSVIMLTLVSFIGLVLYRYSRRYLHGEPERERYDTALMLTLGSVATVLVSDHLLVILLGWTAISLSLHTLLTFYPERPRAVLAAHKKFLFARLAELALLVAFVLLWLKHDTWSASQIIARYPVEQLELVDHAVALLIAVAALIKCAQLPVHGWLLQVVEAPTPVSALLHAGVVNLGGYLLILFGPVWLQSPVAQWVILLAAGGTALLAALSMAVRVSIKVKLAWSTCAQMALMLIECALGLFELALLHLVAHSCYKAHAFLASSSAPEQWRLHAWAPSARPRTKTWVLAAALSAIVVTSAAQLSNQTWAISPWLLLMAALTVILAEQRSKQVGSDVLFFVGFAGAVLLAYLTAKSLAGLVVTHSATPPSAMADSWVSALVIALFTGHLVLRHAPESPSARALTRLLYAGLYLDEWATRTTLLLWPLQLPVPAHIKRAGTTIITQDSAS